ncbi:MAG TPA: diguanylate cyclase [Anaerolineae bacterium]|nr:diguanylate cyclase [Anaerolineae bacterium]
MSRRAWAYIWGILLAGVAMSAYAIATGPATSAFDPLALVILAGLTILTQFLEAEAPGRQSYYPHLVFLFAGMLLLPPAYFVLLVAVPHLVEWVRKRLANSPMLRNWYIQPFNISTHLVAGFAARWVFVSLVSEPRTFTTPAAMLAVMLSALVYVLINHLLIGFVIFLARGIGLRKSGVLDIGNLGGDLIQLFLGCVIAVLWQLNPLLILPALSPLVMIHRALSVPQLKQEAQTDAKTGLWNARHFNKLFAGELERARRFHRPLAVIVADLDLLRNINNTYGHLAGDAVLARVGQIIREAVREYDIAARFGGEEFCIALPETEPAEALDVADRLRQAIATAEFEAPTSPTPIRATMSFGVADFPGDGATPDDLIHAADVAVYQAKLRGRNCVSSAADVPHSAKLERPPGADQAESTYAAAYASKPQPSGNGRTPASGTGPAHSGAHGSVSATGSSGQASTPPTDAIRPSVWLPWCVGIVIGLGVAATALGVALQPAPDAGTLALFVVLAAFAEALQVSVYGVNTVSASMAVVFASALVTGLPGVAAVSAGIVLTHYVQTKPRVYQTAFNWAVHVLAGLAPSFVIHAWSVLPATPNVVLLGVLALFAGWAYYAIETGLIASAISLSQGARLRIVWQRQFRWLTSHYLVLSLLGVFLAVAYWEIGLPGVMVFALPALMMRYAQKQYVDRTEESMRELKRMNLELTTANREIANASRAIRQLNDELFLTLSKIIDARDPYAAGHAAQVAHYATTIGARLGLRGERLEHLRQAALLHDIGKLGIPERILFKPGVLTSGEYDAVKTHTTRGAEFLETCRGLHHLTPFVRHHHEWWDGRGYPDGWRGEQTPLEARILAVCDAVEAMASDRPYHPAMSPAEVVAELRRCAGTQFDPQVVEAFVEIVEQEGEGFVVNSAREVARQSTRAIAPGAVPRAG